MRGLLKYISGMILFLIVCGLPLQMAQGQTPIQLLVNGEQVISDVDPMIIDGRTMVPLRVIADSLGRYVWWDQDNWRVVISRNEAGTRSLPSRSRVNGAISILVDGKEIESEVPPFIENGRTMVPIRVIAEGLGMEVEWDPASRAVSIDEEIAAEPEPPKSTEGPILDNPVVSGQDSQVDPNTTIMGKAQASAEQLKALLQQNNPDASPELADLYLQIGEQYGLRGDIAFCQAAKETGWWRFGGLVQAYQNNFCGLGATGNPATGDEDLLGADAAHVSYQPGVHGAIFDTMATGVEAHIQHLYAYARKDPLPMGKNLIDPRFSRPARGCAPHWVDLGGKWAVPGYNRSLYASYEEAFQAGETYGHSILNDYYAQLF